MESKPRIRDSRARYHLYLILPLLVMATLWASWPALRIMVERWEHDPRYSHGFLVPLFAAYLLWHRRELLPADQVGGTIDLRGLLLIGVGVAMRLAGARYYVDWLDAASILPTLAGIIWLVAGLPTLRWSGPSIAFLIFMIPLPYRIEVALGAPLQRLATIASHYTLQTLGLPAVMEGNVILLGEKKIGIVEACNGLGMLYMFAAFAVAVVLIIPRSPLDKILVLLSAAPIALTANIIRITLTGLLHETAGHQVADAVYHDLAGWLMMPVALMALWLELLILSRLFINVKSKDPMLVHPMMISNYAVRDLQSDRHG